MSDRNMTRNIYDRDSYDEKLMESRKAEAYMLEYSKYVNDNRCRIEQGIVGGNNVSKYQGNMIDLDSYLNKGLSRNLGNTVAKNAAYQPNCAQDDGISGIPCGNNQPNLRDLPSCRMIDSQATPQNIPLEPNQCKYSMMDNGLQRQFEG